jgi:hypothetical protein
MTSNKSADEKVVKVELGHGWKKAIRNFDQDTTGEDAKYNVAIIGHSAH